MKILFVTGSRGEWGYIKPILKLIENESDLEYELCVTNMHLLPSYGNSFQEIINDGFKIDYQIPISLDGYDHFTQVKSLGLFLISFSDVLLNSKPDWILLAGDRGEQLIGSIAGAYTYIPIGHIQAGERSGNIDGTARHAIGKFSHLHFASNLDAKERLIRMGEEKFRCHNVGAPQIDEMINTPITGKEELIDKYNVELSRYLLFVQHPVTEDFEDATKQIRTTIEALNQLENFEIITILPNNDAGSIEITNGIKKLRTSRFKCFSNLPRKDYLGFLSAADAMIGNSSSGLLEAPTYKIPAVNIGRRQHGRIQGKNVINCNHEKGSIINALKKALSKEFKSELISSCVNPYGDGNSSQRILSILKETKIDRRLIIKDITY